NARCGPSAKDCSCKSGWAGGSDRPVGARWRQTGLALWGILLLLAISIPHAEAQLDRLRKTKPIDLTLVPETPVADIPAGAFLMGFDGTQGLDDERPSHRPWVDRFSIDRHEVTAAQYGIFLNAVKRPAPWQWETVELSLYGDRPVIGVDWFDADAYCRWKGK